MVGRIAVLALALGACTGAASDRRVPEAREAGATPAQKDATRDAGSDAPSDHACQPFVTPDWLEPIAFPGPETDGGPFVLCGGGVTPALPEVGAALFVDPGAYPGASLVRDDDHLYVLQSSCSCVGTGCIVGAGSCSYSIDRHDLCTGAVAEVGAGATLADDLLADGGVAFWIDHGSIGSFGRTGPGHVERLGEGDSSSIAVRGDSTVPSGAMTVLDVRLLAAEAGRLYLLEADVACADALAPAGVPCEATTDASRRLISMAYDVGGLDEGDEVTRIAEGAPGSSLYDLLDAQRLGVGPDGIYLLSAGRLWRLAISGGDPEPVPCSPTNVADFQVHGETVYVATTSGMIVDVTTEGRAPDVLGYGGFSGGLPFAVDETSVYFTDLEGGTDAANDASCSAVRRVSRTGGPEDTVLGSLCDLRPRGMTARGGQLLVHLGTQLSFPPFPELAGAVVAAPARGR